jgi:sulfur carrier protein
MKIKFNGQMLETNSKNLDEFINSLEQKPSSFALVLNGQIIPKSLYKETLISDNDVIEIFTLMAGG